MRIKKTSQTAALPAQVVNTYSDSTKDAYSCDYVNAALIDTYSTNEVKTNKVWIDGRSIYKRVFTGNWDGTGTLSISLPSGVNLFNVYGYCYDGYKRPLNSNWSGSQLLSMIFQDNLILVTQSGSLQQLNYVNYVIIAEYIKSN